MMFRVIEPHFCAVVAASSAACDLLEVLPECDLIDEMKNLIHIQFDLLAHLLEGKHYGTDNINNFIEYTNVVKREISELKGSNGDNFSI